MQRKVDSKFLCHIIGYIQVNLKFYILKLLPHQNLFILRKVVLVRVHLLSFHIYFALP